MPALAVLKGSFQSEGRMVPVAVSGVGEQAFRVVVILLGTWIAVRAGASLYTSRRNRHVGAVVGELAGVIILALYFRKNIKRAIRTGRPLASRKGINRCQFECQCKFAYLLLFQLVDSFTVFQILLSNGFLEETAMETKGVYNGDNLLSNGHTDCLDIVV